MFEAAEEPAFAEYTEKQTKRQSAGSGISSASSHDVDAIERGTHSQEKHEDSGLWQHNPSLDLKRTASNVLSKVASRITTRSNVNPPPPPDGGLKAWTQVAMCWLVVLITWGWINSYGVFQTYYSLNMDVSASTISWIGSVQNFLTFFIGAFSGRLLDAGLYIPTLIVGGTIQVLGIFFMSLSTTYWQLMLTQGIMTGIGGGIFFTPSMGLIGTYFSSKRAIAVGLATTGNSAGGMIYPVFVQQLLPKLGFAWTVRVLGFFNLALLCIIVTFMRPRLPPRKTGPMIDFTAFKEPPYALFVAAVFFVMWPIYYTFYYLSSYANEVIGISFANALTITIILNGAGMPFRVIPPFFADRYGQLNVAIPTLLILVVVAFCWIAVSGTTGIYVYVVFYGAASGAFQCLFPSTIASLTTDMSKFGTRLGMGFSCLAFAALTGPSLGGAIMAAMDGKYLGAQLWAALATTVCTCLVVATRFSKVGWTIHVKV